MDQSIHDVRRSNWLNIVNECQQMPANMTVNRNINKLSGGEQQRVAIARAISTNAEVILADEPTGNLDVDTAAGIVKIFKELAHEDKKCVIAVTHSEAFAAEADVVVRLEKKKLQD